jgi:hypothetical protein
MSLAVALTDRVARVVESRTTRRGFVNRSAMVGSALALSGSYVLRPGTAYAAICSCPRRSGAATRECNCSDLCCDGYTEFCCQIYGKNSCPADTVMAGWWKVDQSSYCDGSARYYMDCNQLNPPCACGPAGACRAADATCQCRSCSNRSDGCTVFRYGNCNNDITCVGPIMCRVVTCSKPWEIDPGCTMVARTDPATASHHRPCLEEPIDLAPEAMAWTVAVFNDYMGRFPNADELLEYATRVTNGEDRTEVSISLSRTHDYIGSFLDVIYPSVFNRAIDAAGREYWTRVIREGTTPAQVAALLYASDEFYEASGDVYGFVWRLYSEILGRQPENEGLLYWADEVDSSPDRSVITASFYGSIESRRKRVTSLYWRFLDREPDHEGREFWAEQLLREDDLALATFLSGSEEYFNKAQQEN